MNLFVQSPDPYISAAMLDNKRVVKMTVETVQLLSTAMHLNGATTTPYKPTHPHHPVTLWCARSRGNYLWALEHLRGLASEYTRRYGKIHKSSLYIPEVQEGALWIPDGVLQPFVNCARNKDKGVDFTHIQDVHLAYRLYLQERNK